MKKLAVVLIALSLAGCSATVDELRKNRPAAEGDTDKSVQAFSACVLDEWDKYSYLQPVITRPLVNGYSMRFDETFHGPVFLLDVTEKATEDGAHYKLYRSYTIDFYEYALLKCKEGTYE